MAQKKILCFGDSNTYGYDPRSFLGGRYEADSRWCDLLSEQLGCTVLNYGENGRALPRHTWEHQVLQETLEANAPVDLLILMLGTNDLLMDLEELTATTAGRLETMLDSVQAHWPMLPILLLPPLPMGVPLPGLNEKVCALGLRYAQIAADRSLLFCDTTPWHLPLAYDRVHLSPEGHQQLAEQLGIFLKRGRRS